MNFIQTLVCKMFGIRVKRAYNKTGKYAKRKRNISPYVRAKMRRKITERWATLRAHGYQGSRLIALKDWERISSPTNGQAAS